MVFFYIDFFSANQYRYIACIFNSEINHLCGSIFHCWKKIQAPYRWFLLCSECSEMYLYELEDSFLRVIVSMLFLLVVGVVLYFLVGRKKWIALIFFAFPVSYFWSMLLVFWVMELFGIDSIYNFLWKIIWFIRWFIFGFLCWEWSHILHKKWRNKNFCLFLADISITMIFVELVAIASFIIWIFNWRFYY